MSPTPDPPKPKTISSALWMKIVGALIATVLFAAFLIFGGLASAGMNVAFNCDSFRFFAPAFAVGGAMAAMFLGGGAAVAGNLGEKLQGQALGVSLTGGVAVMVIMFGIFFGLKPDGCGAPDQDALLEFRAVPDTVSVFPGPELWTRQNTHDHRDDYEVSVLVAPGVSQQELILLQEGERICTVRVTFDQGLPAQLEGFAYDHFEMPRRDSFKLDFALRVGGEVTETVGCFRHGATLAEEEIAVATATGQVRFARRVIDASTRVDQFAGGAGLLVAPSPQIERFSLIAPAHAASFDMPYEELRNLLISDNEKLRVEARQILAQDFDRYSQDALRDLRSQRNLRNPDLISSLLSGLISGIETAQPSLKPAEGRSLDQTLPYIGGQEELIMTLAAHPDASVRQQARRLMQRFPVDAFQPLMQQAVADAEAGLCSTPSVGWRLYATIFFNYNRLIQEGLEGVALSSETDWDNRATRIQAMAEKCIAGVEQVDAALLDYGRALAYAWSGDESRSRAAVADFQSYIRGKEQNYYMQGHIERMQQLWN